MSGTSGRIAETARALLAAEGASAVSMRRVAAEVGITPMAIYRHYPNKEALLSAVADTAFRELMERWQARPRAAGGVGARLHDLLDALLDFAVIEPNLYRFLFTEQRPGARTFPESFRTGASPTLNLLADVIGDGMREAVLRDADVWDVAFTVAAHLQGLILLYHGGRTDPSIDRYRVVCHSSLDRIIDGLKA